jgi:hypothetical protein
MHLIENNSELYKRYLKALNRRGDLCVDKMEATEKYLINGDITPTQARLILENQRWKASKFYPQLFGDKQEVEFNGSITQPIVIKFKDEFDSRITDNSTDTININ